MCLIMLMIGLLMICELLEPLFCMIPDFSLCKETSANWKLPVQLLISSTCSVNHTPFLCFLQVIVIPTQWSCQKQTKHTQDTGNSASTKASGFLQEKNCYKQLCFSLLIYLMWGFPQAERLPNAKSYIFLWITET